jgi:hypothetical protein
MTTTRGCFMKIALSYLGQKEWRYKSLASDALTTPLARLKARGRRSLFKSVVPLVAPCTNNLEAFFERPEHLLAIAVGSRILGGLADLSLRAAATHKAATTAPTSNYSPLPMVRTYLRRSLDGRRHLGDRVVGLDQFAEAPAKVVVIARAADGRARLRSRLVEEEREVLNDASALEAAAQGAGDHPQGANKGR